MSILQFASLQLKDGAFIYGVLNHAPAVFSSIDHVVKENTQVMSELEELRGENMSMSNLIYLLTKASRDQRKLKLSIMPRKSESNCWLKKWRGEKPSCLL